jgi:hypothetical protein
MKLSKEKFLQELKTDPIWKNAIVRKYVMTRASFIKRDDFVWQILEGSGKSEIYMDPDTNEWHIIGDEKGGKFFISGVSIEMKEDGRWETIAIRPKHSKVTKKEKLEELFNTMGLNLSFRWCLPYGVFDTNSKRINFKCKIGPYIFNLSKKGKNPLKIQDGTWEFDSE